MPHYFSPKESDYHWVWRRAAILKNPPTLTEGLSREEEGFLYSSAAEKKRLKKTDYRLYKSQINLSNPEWTLIWYLWIQQHWQKPVHADEKQIHQNLKEQSAGWKVIPATDWGRVRNKNKKIQDVPQQTRDLTSQRQGSFIFTSDWPDWLTTGGSRGPSAVVSQWTKITDLMNELQTSV